MINKKILIDACYLNSKGGIVILKQILSYIKTNKLKDFTILIDKRNIHLNNLKGMKCHSINKNELSRTVYYIKNKKKLKSILCLSNFPPPIKIKTPVFIYFHNVLFFSSKNKNIPTIKRLKFSLKNIYLKFLNNKKYNWLVQTQIVKNLLIGPNKFRSNKVFIYPIFTLNEDNLNEKKDFFVYPTSNIKNKNNENLIKAFIDASRRIDKKLTLNITLNKKELNLTSKLPKSLQINFLGELEHEDLMKLISKARYLIFPSFEESFGLPLIEGKHNFCIILASNKEYVKELIDADFYFNPKNVKDMSSQIIKSLKLKLPTTNKVKVEDHTNKLIERITNV